MVSSLIDFEPVQSLGSASQIELLDVVDKLRAQGLSDFTALPQLIVCGDQSSGKSSVLQAISGLSFPRKDNLCTRFATEVILRRVPKTGISVSIVPGHDRSATDREHLSAFRSALLNTDQFASLFEDAKKVMGLTEHGSAFSKDILRVEISGPSQPQLTIVDLPGLIHSESKSQTAQDVDLVTVLVRSYMKNPRSIILAVVSAKNDFPNQIVLKRAREVDPEGLRTLGIITKPDTLPGGSDSEMVFLSLARNEQVEFKLGWHVVKNQDLGKGDFDPEERDKEEMEYFETSSFKTLPVTTRGVSRLRQRLSKVLFNQIRRQLPNLILEIEQGSASCEAALEKLGPARATIEEQRKLLIDLSEEFQNLCRDAINGPYDNPFFGDVLTAAGKEKRLRAVVRNMQIDFAEIIRTQGSKWDIVEQCSSNERHRTREEAVAEILNLLKHSRGKELPGLPNPLLVTEVFREYSSPWSHLARTHIQQIFRAVKILIERILEYLAEPVLGDALLRVWLDPLMDECLRNACAKLDELLAVREKHPITTNHYFQETVHKMRRKRRELSLGKKLSTLLISNAGKLYDIHIPAIISAAYPEETNPDMDEEAAEDVFDNTNAFYKVAMKLFIDNVPTVVTEVTLLIPLLSMFCPKVVYNMDPKIVERIAAESEEKRSEREELTRKLNILTEGRTTCRLYAKRASTAMEEPSKPVDAAEPGKSENPEDKVNGNLGPDPEEIASD
ncbi:hypothetical protein MMC07_003642 [Pseudocyphellaria aurata]|nr:hypothetical protein [Pseudocyphellaria aurata]